MIGNARRAALRIFSGKIILNLGFGTNSLSQNLTVLTAPSEREPLAWRYSLRLKRKVSGRARSPLGELSRSD